MSQVTSRPTPAFPGQQASDRAAARYLGVWLTQSPDNFDDWEEQRRVLKAALQRFHKVSSCLAPSFAFFRETVNAHYLGRLTFVLSTAHVGQESVDACAEEAAQAAFRTLHYEPAHLDSSLVALAHLSQPSFGGLGMKDAEAAILTQQLKDIMCAYWAPPNSILHNA